MYCSDYLKHILNSSIQHWTGSPSHFNKARKCIWIGNEEVKLSLLRENMIIYIHNPKECIQ